MNPLTIILISLFATILPLVTFGVLYYFGRKLPRRGDWLATTLMFVTFILSLSLFIISYNEPIPYIYNFSWFRLPGIAGSNEIFFSIKIDFVSSLMMTVVTFISLLVHFYSMEYMYDKKNYPRYFPFLGLFTSSMLGIVISNNLLFTFMCWEVVGFASYLLIGFWSEKLAAARASKKAFLINRIGDAGFVIGIILFYIKFNTLDIDQLTSLALNSNEQDLSLLTIAGLGILLGALGKSAQFPLHLWLPDAMEGPTPASALIHAATMVAAGIYLLFKVFYLLTPDVLYLISFVGAITSFVGALPALFQSDIKKVLAYSTISQLGYMVMAIGIGAYQLALFHLLTHAFFKACLFLCAGTVIHEMHHVKISMFVKGYFDNFDTLDMRLMGNLRKKLPMTFIAYSLSAFALIGLPFTSGFLSKDAILDMAWNKAAFFQVNSFDYLFYLVPLLATFTVFLTALYMFRQYILVFWGKFRLLNLYPSAKDGFEKMHDPGLLMKWPMLILSVFSVFIFYSINPFHASHGWFMNQMPDFEYVHFYPSWTIVVLSILAILAGMGIAWTRYITYYNPQILIEETTKNYLFTWLKLNYKFDVLFLVFFKSVILRISKLIKLFDVKILDGFIHLFSIGVIVMANIIRFVDKFVIDGVVNYTSTGLYMIGNKLKLKHQGAVQNYIVYTLIILLLSIIYLMYL